MTVYENSVKGVFSLSGNDEPAENYQLNLRLPSALQSCTVSFS